MNTTTMKTLAVALGCLCAFAAARAQDRIAVPLSEPSRPATLEINTLGSRINVSAYDGKEIVIATRTPTAREEADDDEQPRQGLQGRQAPRAPQAPRGRARGDDGSSIEGLHRVTNNSVGMTATEENNVVTLKTDFSHQALALDISVPRNTSVHAKTVNGDLTVTGVSGDHEISSVNGRLVANDLVGSVVASTTNGTIRASFADVAANKAMSFNSFNGNVDVTFPAKLSATFRVSSGRGEFYTDFDVTLQPQAPVVTQGGQNGRYEVKMERETVATVGRGGPDIRFKTFNGNVMIRKR